MHVKTFWYLGYELNTRGSYGTFLNHILHDIRSRTPMLKILFKYEQRVAIQLRWQIFYSFIFPFFVWTFLVSFYFGTSQQVTLHRVFVIN